jgi:hypothetical protein
VSAQALQPGASGPPIVHGLCEQVPQLPQSVGQEEHVSLPLQVPSPHDEHDCPQMLETSPTHWASQEVWQQYGSLWQIADTQGSQLGLSGPPVTHLLWVHAGHAPQSEGQLWQDSPDWQTPLPQTGGHAPQSEGQLWQDSPD